ncbi:hypothetical protein EVAR_53061_1 [Eumeta japonica]|uniref:Uncharacterized protein n=1 Tax=Eumeta variegata TaxID=151549 RepID=A0A4C1YXX5_EUMVA|nr:hypothetical protein EVAR_53061_1 [Eumeta japonica]
MSGAGAGPALTAGAPDRAGHASLPCCYTDRSLSSLDTSFLHISRRVRHRAPRLVPPPFDSFANRRHDVMRATKVIWIPEAERTRADVNEFFSAPSKLTTLQGANFRAATKTAIATGLGLKPRNPGPNRSVTEIDIEKNTGAGI